MQMGGLFSKRRGCFQRAVQRGAPCVVPDGNLRYRRGFLPHIIDMTGGTCYYDTDFYDIYGAAAEIKRRNTNMNQYCDTVLR